VLSEEAGIYHQFDDVTLKLGPRSFFQVTPKIAKELYANVGERVRDYQITSFLDLYSGVGAFSFFAARYAQDVKGVEISKEAIDSAKAAVSLNQISGKIDFVAEDVEKYLKEHKQQSEAILVNPPRRGLNPEIIKSLLDYAPEYLFYSSCNAKSLREDYELLKGQYGIVSTQVFDMFPYTEHYETLMVLKKHR
jgi:23S rRNA (uracil747-C5)-methyltransferase